VRKEIYYGRRDGEETVESLGVDFGTGCMIGRTWEGGLALRTRLRCEGLRASEDKGTILEKL
jgi:hypothetical protein